MDWPFFSFDINVIFYLTSPALEKAWEILLSIWKIFLLAFLVALIDSQCVRNEKRHMIEWMVMLWSRSSLKRCSSHCICIWHLLKWRISEEVPSLYFQWLNLTNLSPFQESSWIDLHFFRFIIEYIMFLLWFLQFIIYNLGFLPIFVVAFYYFLNFVVC